MKKSVIQARGCLLKGVRNSSWFGLLKLLWVVETIFAWKVPLSRLEMSVLGAVGIPSPHQCSGEQAGGFSDAR